jgi:hypothetical protein
MDVRPGDRWLRIEAPHYVAAASFRWMHGRLECVDPAPILRWMRGKTWAEVRAWLAGKRYPWAWLTSDPETRLPGDSG